MELARLLGLHKQGGVTRHELVLQLCALAVDGTPEQIAAQLPADVLDEVRARATNPPASPHGIFVVQSVCATGEYDHQRAERELSQRLHQGLWRWHEYFACPAPHAGE